MKSLIIIASLVKFNVMVIDYNVNWALAYNDNSDLNRWKGEECSREGRSTLQSLYIV